MNEFCTTVPITGPTSSIEDIERSIIKKFRKELWSKFTKGIKEFNLINDGDHVAVCISGGKDSLLLAKMMQELQRHHQKDLKLSFIAMDPGFNQANRDLLEETSKKIGIDLHIFDTKIFEIVDKIANDYPCYMCARMRRGSLYDMAKKLGANKIALGHHYDDFIETTMLNVMYAGSFKTMLPKIKSTNYEGIELIRPLVYVEEKDIISFTKHNNIAAMNCGCVVAAKQTSSKRAEVKQTIKDLEKINPDIKKSIFSSSKNVNVDAIIGGKIKGRNFTYDDDILNLQDK